MLAISREAVTKYVQTIKSSGLSFKDIKDYSESELYSLICKYEKMNNNRDQQGRQNKVTLNF